LITFTGLIIFLDKMGYLPPEIKTNVRESGQ